MTVLVTKEKFESLYKLKIFSKYAISKYKLRFPVIGNENLARIVSFLTFDGHLTLNKHMFLFYSRNVSELNRIRNVVNKEFGINGKMKLVKTNLWGKSYECRFCNLPVVKILFLSGVPSGPKVKTRFSVPNWIFSKKKFMRAYLQTAFDCEGSVWMEKNGRLKLRFATNKESNLVQDGINFTNCIRKLLSRFGIRTTEIWISEGTKRKDGLFTKRILFDVKTESIKRFNVQIGFTVRTKSKLIKAKLSHCGTVRHKDVV